MGDWGTRLHRLKLLWRLPGNSNLKRLAQNHEQ